MRRPDQWFNVPYASFTDAVGPSINQAFLNTLQEGLQDIAGCIFGRSATLMSDEFTERSYGATKAGLFDVVTNVNGAQAAVAPIGPGDHGVLKVSAVAAANLSYRLEDAAINLSTFDYAFSGKAAVTDRSVLLAAAADGFVIGIRNPPAGLGLESVFVCGSDLANWQVRIKNLLIDTGVPVVNGQMFRFQISRISGTAYAFIDGLLVATVAFPDALPALVRQIKIEAPGAAIGDGFFVDYHRVWYQR